MPQPFNNAVITNDGASLLTMAQAGEIKIEFTRIAVGNGNYTEAEKTLDILQNQIALKSLKNSYAISDIEVFNEHSVKVTVLITNQDPVTGQTLVDTGYYINEIGLFAKVKDGTDDTEILYSIATTAGENGDFMPPYNGYNPAQIIQEYYVTVSNSAEVTIEGNTGAVALAEDLQETNGRLGSLEEKTKHYKALRITGTYDSGTYYVGFASLPLPKSQGRAEVTLLVSGIGNAEKPSCGTYLVQCSTRNEICMTVTELTPSGISESNPGTAFGYWMKDDRVCFGMRREAFSYCTNITVVSEDVDEEGSSRYEVAELYNSMVMPSGWTNAGIRKFLEEKEDAESASGCVTLWSGIICNESEASVSFYVPKRYWHNDNLTLMIDCVKYQHGTEVISPPHSKTVMATVTRKREIYVVVDNVPVLNAYSAAYDNGKVNKFNIHENFSMSGETTMDIMVDAEPLTTTDYAEVTVHKLDSSKYVITDIYAVMPQEQEG